MKVIMLTTGSYQEVYLTDRKHSVEGKISITKTKGFFPFKLLLKLSIKFYLTKLFKKHAVPSWEGNGRGG